MQWRGRRESSNVEDRRGISGKGVAVGGGVVGLLFVLFQLFLGDGNVDLNQVLPQQQREMSPQEQQHDNELASFVKVVLADTEDVWDKIFGDMGKTYEKPTMVLFRNSVASGCGSATSASGPFYCPADQKIYIDLAFSDDLRQQFGAPGEFALAYTVAHEVGHHVQNLLGVTRDMEKLRRQLGETEYNKFSVRLELQADFYAGLWARYNQKMKNVIDPNDITEALRAASAIGDDAIQRKFQGSVNPDSFTHGTSEQRVYWFKKGYETGDFYEGNTFAPGTY